MSEYLKLAPPPEQKQLKDIVNLAAALSAGGTSISSVLKCQSYPATDLGDGITFFSVTSLTDIGQKAELNLHIADIKIFRENEDGIIRTEYNVSKQDNNKLRIDRFESVATEREWEKSMEEIVAEVMNIDTMERAVAALDIMNQHLRKMREFRDFERSIGYSYVDREEAQSVLDILNKVVVKTFK